MEVRSRIEVEALFNEMIGNIADFKVKFDSITRKEMKYLNKEKFSEANQSYYSLLASITNIVK